MSTFKVTNTTNTPIHVKVSNAGITYWYQNWLKPGQEFTVDGPAAVWFDLTFEYATHENEFGGKENVGTIGGIIATVLGVLAMIAGVAMMIVPGAQPVGVMLVATAITGITGVVSTVGGIAVTVAHQGYFPASIGNIYGGNSYVFDVTGGFTVERDPEHSDRFLITAGHPIGVNWRNLTSGSSGHEGGPVVQLPHTVAQELATPFVGAGTFLSGADAVVRGASPTTSDDAAFFERNGQTFLRVHLHAPEIA